MGERVAAVLRQPGVPAEHEPWFQGGFGGCRVPHRQRPSGRERCSERMDGPGDRQPPERRAAVGQGGRLGRQRFLEPVLRQRLCVQHGLPQRRRRSGADRGFGVGGWRQHLAAASDLLGHQQQPDRWTSGLRGADRQPRCRLRRVGGRRHPDPPERLLPGPLDRRREQLREAPSRRPGHRRRGVRPRLGSHRLRRLRRDPHRQLPQPEHRQRRADWLPTPPTPSS